MSGRDIIISATVGFFLWLVLLAAGAIYFSRKNPAEKRKAFKKMQDRVDKALKGTDDPSEPARWVR